MSVVVAVLAGIGMLVLHSLARDTAPERGTDFLAVMRSTKPSDWVPVSTTAPQVWPHHGLGSARYRRA